MKTRHAVIAVMAMLVTGSLLGQNALQFTGTKATVERAIQLNWNSVTNGLYELDYTDSISDNPTQWKPLYINYASQGTNTLFLDAGVYYQGETVEHPRNFPQRFYRVIQTGTNQAAPPIVTITDPTNGFVASGLLNISVSYSSSIPVAQIHIFVDGEEARVAGDSSETNFVINTCEWPNGPHSLYAVVDGISGVMSSSVPSGILFSSGVSPFVQVQFNNFISLYNFSQSWFQPSLGQTQNISAEFAAFADWTLTIVDPQSNVVRTASGTGFNMSYAWDGTDQSGNPTLDGTFAYFLSASNSVSSPPSAPSSGAGTSRASAPGFGATGDSQQGNASGLDEVVQEEIPWAIYPPGTEPPPPQTSELETPVVQSIPSSPSFALDAGSVSDAQQPNGPLPAPQQPQITPQPSRPETRTQKGTSGSIGMVALQNYTPASNKPRKIIGTVNIDLSLPAPSLSPWPAIMANNFQIVMKRGNFTNAFNKTDRQITADQLQGSTSNIFNTGVDFGLMMSHGARGLQQDDLATSTPSLQTYVPFPPSGGQYSWIPISNMKFGGSQLKWMGLYACNMLFDDNYNDLFDKNLLPLTPNLHMFMTGSTTIWGNGVFGVKLGESLTGKTQTATNAPTSVLESWFSAATAAHQAINTASPGLITINVSMRVIYWPACVGDTIYQFAASSGGSDDQSTSSDDERQVYP